MDAGTGQSGDQTAIEEPSHFHISGDLPRVANYGASGEAASRDQV